MKKKINKIGILGGTFDPCHLGHLKISIHAKKNLKLSKIIWAITKKNPYKSVSNLSLEKRIKESKKFKKKYKLIQIKYFEKIIRSNLSFNLVSYLKNKLANTDLYLIIGADNLINLHKWSKWKNIPKKCNIRTTDIHTNLKH